MRSKLMGVAILAAAALTIAACGGGQSKDPTSSAAPSPTGATSSAAPVDTVFTYAPNLEVVTEWDPAKSYSNELIAMQNIYESLTRYDITTQKTVGVLAESWTVSADGLEWTFKLRSGVTFHTGRALDATAAKEALDRTIKIGAGAAYIWGAVSEITAVDAQTLKFTLSYPVALDQVAAAAYASYIYDVTAAPESELEAWFNKGNDAGTGPYTIASYEKGAEVEVSLKANPDYWGGWDGTHYDTVNFRVTPEVTTAWQLVQTGEVDFIQRANPEIFEQAKTTPTVQVSETGSFQNLLALYNTASGPLADVRVRKAIQMAVDYDGLLASLKGSAVAASGFVPEGLLGYTPGLSGKQDLTAAAALLKEAGYGEGGKPLSLVMTYAQGDDAQQTLATLLSSAIQTLGGTLDARPMEWNAQWDMAKSTDTAGRQDIFVMYWYPDYADAYSWPFNLYVGSEEPFFNLSYYNDPALNAEIEALPALTVNDPAAAQAAYEKINTQVTNELALSSYFYVQNYQRILAGSVKGYVDNPAYPNVTRVYDMSPAS